jgi:hypothetical protein
MDPAIFQLFSLGEILARLGQTLQTGCLHIFNQREAANIYFKDGIVVAATKSPLDGEEVVKQVVEWKDARMVWQPNEVAPASSKSFGINIADYLHSSKSEPEKKKEKTLKLDQVIVKDGESHGPKLRLGTASVSKPAVFIAEIPAAAISASPAAKTAASPSLSRPEPSVPMPQEIVQPISMPSIQLTATKAMPSTAQMRSTQEEALLRKHKLILVSGEDRTQRFKIARASSLIGRNPACDINLNRASVSRQHCLLHLTDRGLHLKDLGTTNGTKVNGIALTEGYVNPGDKLTIGHELFILEKDPT